MGSKNKLKRFRENETFPNVVQPEREVLLNGQFQQKGQWSFYFGNDNPIVLELGCGKGEYTLGLARRNAEVNYIGVDIKGARILAGSQNGPRGAAVQCGLSQIPY